MSGSGVILGIDLGSRNVKLALMADGEVTDTRTVETMKFYMTYGTRSSSGFGVDLESLGYGMVDRIVATGYGRMAASFSGADNISEVTAHYLGALYQFDRDTFTLLDLGGQDFKIIRIDDGIMTDFVTNDKCAASTGRYLENMAGVLGLSMEAMGSYSEDPVKLSSTCAIFGESELIGLIVGGEPVPRLAAGVNLAVVARVLPQLERMGQGIIVMSGGVALNSAVVSMFAEAAGRRVVVLDDPVHNGALGCCVKGQNLGIQD